MVPDKLAGALDVEPYRHGILPRPRFLRGLKDSGLPIVRKKLALLNSEAQQAWLD